jgi:hypothetical protein
MELTSDQKGGVAELAIARRAIELGFDVYRPMCEGGRYDLILGAGDRLLRVQCKWAPRHGDVVVVRCYSARRTRQGLRRRTYSRSEIDAIVAYCAEIDRCFVIFVDRCHGRSQFHLRLCASRNSQRAGVNWADDFALESLQCSEVVGP